MKRAHSIKDLLSMKKEVIPFEGDFKAAFGQPERTGVWCIWGGSTGGKSTLAMILAKELIKYGRVAYYSLEEGNSLPFVERLKRHGFTPAEKRMQVFYHEHLEELDERMKQRKSHDFYIIDSIQYAGMPFKEFLKLRRTHSNKLIIALSQAEGNEPSGRMAKAVKFDADLKIQLIGKRAINLGRTIGDLGYYDIQPEFVEKYWEPLKQ